MIWLTVGHVNSTRRDRSWEVWLTAHGVLAFTKLNASPSTERGTG